MKTKITNLNCYHFEVKVEDDSPTLIIRGSTINSNFHEVKFKMPWSFFKYLKNTLDNSVDKQILKLQEIKK